MESFASSARRGVGSQPRAGLAAPYAWLAALGIAWLGGCTAFGSGARYRALQEDWERGARPPVELESEDLLARAPVLEREPLVREVLRRNPDARAARYAWRAALARYPQETSLDDPMLGYGVAPRSFGSSRVDDSHKVELAQAFPFPGKLTLRGEMALAEAEAAAHEHEEVRLRLATMASLLFDDHYLLARSVEINAKHIRILEEFQRIATARYEAGEASQQDPLQAEVEVARLLERDVTLRTAQRVTAEQINLLLHRPIDRAVPPAPARLSLPPLADLDPAGRVAAAIAAHPEVRAAEARVRSGEAAVDLAQREFLPDLTLIGMYDGVWQERELQPFVGVSINVPLRLERRRAALDQARASVERARSERAAREDAVRFGVRSGLERLDEARRILEIYEDRLLPAANDQIEAARAGFETGRNSFLAVIEAEHNLHGVELGHEEALTNVSRRSAELERATGRLPVHP